MIQTLELLSGVTLRYCPDHRFKHGCLSFQLVRPMCAEEAALNALIPSVLLRGTTAHPDLRSITLALDELYGASVSTLVRRGGNYQTTGLFCSFIEDRYALPGDAVLKPMTAFLGELLLCPRTQDEGFVPEIVESEKRNLISTIDSDRNDKRAYAMAQMMRIMCKGDCYSIPRLGEREQVAAITPRQAYRHYQRILRQSPIELFYVGAAALEQVVDMVTPILNKIERDYVNLPPHTPFSGENAGQSVTEQMEVTQARLCMGFYTPIDNRSEQYAAMQVFNALFGAGMSSKLFMNVRERLSLCYGINSVYYGSKGILVVSAGIDARQEQQVKDEVLRQLADCCRGEITDGELTAAREAILSALRSTHDSPGTIEGYYASAALSGGELSLQAYADAIDRVTLADVAEAARTVQLHTTYFLKGAVQE